MLLSAETGHFSMIRLALYDSATVRSVGFADPIVQLTGPCISLIWSLSSMVNTLDDIIYTLRVRLLTIVLGFCGGKSFFK